MVDVFKCRCGWIYFVRSKSVIGPIMDDSDVSCVRSMTREEWVEAYSDCSRNYLLRGAKPVPH